MRHADFIDLRVKIILSQDPPEEVSSPSKRTLDIEDLEGLKLISETKVIPRR